MLSSRGLRPRKRLGQHFLIDGNLMRGLVESADLKRDDVVVEVGGGTGGLTDLLALRVDQLVCVEVDRDLRELLAERFAGVAGVEVVGIDVLESKHRLAAVVAECIQHAERDGLTVKLVANLPYQIATPLVMNLLVDYPVVRRLCFTVQSEVGDRFVAEPGCKAFGPLTILSGALSRVTTVARLGPQSFWPRPTVDSVMLRMDVDPAARASVPDVPTFARFVRGVFNHRRKTLRSAMSYVLDAAVVEHLGERFDLTRRPEQVPVSQWVSIAKTVLDKPFSEPCP